MKYVLKNIRLLICAALYAVVWWHGDCLTGDYLLYVYRKQYRHMISIAGTDTNNTFFKGILLGVIQCKYIHLLSFKDVKNASGTVVPLFLLNGI